MNNYDDMNQKSNMIIYTTEDGLTKIETTFDEDTVWLSIDQMAELFQRDKSTISRHIKNVFSEGELQRESVVANFATAELVVNSCQQAVISFLVNNATVSTCGESYFLY